MVDLPERFNVEIIDWTYADRLCRRLRDQIRQSENTPDAVLGIARGGWFPARTVADLLDIEDLSSIKIEHHIGEADSNQVKVRYQIDDVAVRGKSVLLIDDSVDSGKTLARGQDYLDTHDPTSVETAVLQKFSPELDHDVDYAAETYTEWRFIINPWEFMENMVDMVNGVLVKQDPGVPIPIKRVYELLEEYHNLSRSAMEMAQGSRLEEVLSELEYRGVVSKKPTGWELQPAGRKRYHEM
jgi:hypoxanthine phosphoribosyltransferase